MAPRCRFSNSSNLPRVRRLEEHMGQSLLNHLPVHPQAVLQIHLGQQALVAVLPLRFIFQANLLSQNQLAIEALGLFRQKLAFPRPSPLRGVNPQIADPPAVFQGNGIPILHAGNLQPLLRGFGPDRVSENKKSRKNRRMKAQGGEAGGRSITGQIEEKSQWRLVP